MTAYVTRSPLQLLTNTHAMGDLRRSSRRTSARVADKEDAPLVNGNGYGGEKAKSSQANGADMRQGKSEANSAGQGSIGAKGKRKHGAYKSAKLENLGCNAAVSELLRHCAGLSTCGRPETDVYEQTTMKKTTDSCLHAQGRSGRRLLLRYRYQNLWLKTFGKNQQDR